MLYHNITPVDIDFSNSVLSTKNGAHDTDSGVVGEDLNEFF